MTLWTVAHKTPQSIEFFRQEYWSGLSFPSPGDFPDPGIEPGSPAMQVDYRLSHQETDIENRLYGHGERGGEGEMHGESNMEIILPYVK